MDWKSWNIYGKINRGKLLDNQCSFWTNISPRRRISVTSHRIQVKVYVSWKTQEVALFNTSSIFATWIFTSSMSSSFVSKSKSEFWLALFFILSYETEIAIFLSDHFSFSERLLALQNLLHTPKWFFRVNKVTWLVKYIGWWTMNIIQPQVQ